VGAIALAPAVGVACFPYGSAPYACAGTCKQKSSGYPWFTQSSYERYPSINVDENGLIVT